MLRSPFAFCPHCGSTCGPGSTHYPRHNEFRCPACGFRYFHNVAAACGLFLVSEGRLLVLERAHEPRKGALGLPGGFVDPDETIENAIFREIREETGLEPARYSSPRYVGGWPNQYDFGGVRYSTMDVFFVAELRDKDAKIHMADGEGAAWHWVGLSELDPGRLAFPSMAHALAKLRGSPAQAPQSPEAT